MKKATTTKHTCKKGQPAKSQPAKSQPPKSWRNRKARRDSLNWALRMCATECDGDILGDIRQARQEQIAVSKNRQKSKSMREWWARRYPEQVRARRHAGQRRQELEAEWAILKIQFTTLPGDP